jgi:hypothetical protein
MQFNLSPEDLPLAGIAQHDHERLTFGVEFEFALAVLREGQKDPDPEDNRTVFSIVDEEQDVIGQGVSVLQHIVKTLTDAEISSVVTDECATLELDDLKVWLVKNNPSVKGPNDGIYTWHSIEVTTPPYYFSSEEAETVKAVCEVLTNSYRISCNETAGLHAHVGNATKGFSLDTLVNFYATIWTFEPQIAEIHPFHRTQDNVFCSSIRTESRMVQNDIQPNTPLASFGLEILLYEMHSMNTLGQSASSNRAIMAYNIEPALKVLNKTSEDSDKNTIEFRQHESTLDPARATNWARFFVGLLDFSDMVDRDVLDDFLGRHIDDSPADFTIGQVLTALGMPYLAEFFTEKVAEQRMIEGEYDEEEYAALEAEVDDDFEKAAREPRDLQISRIKQIEGRRVKSSGEEDQKF